MNSVISVTIEEKENAQRKRKLNHKEIEQEKIKRQLHVSQ